MITNALPDIPRSYTAICEWAACVVYIAVLFRRVPPRRSVVVSAIGLAALIAVQYFDGSMPIWFWIVGMLLAFGCMYLTILFGAGTGKREGLYITARAFVLAELVASLHWQIVTFIGMRNGRFADYDWHAVLLLVATYALCFGLAWLVERGNFSQTTPTLPTASAATATVAITIVTFAMSNLSFVSTNTPFSGSMGQEIFYIRTLVDFCGFAILYAQQEQARRIEASAEIASINAQLESQHQEYLQSKENIESLGRLAHDLKHQIAALRAEVDPEHAAAGFEQLEKSVQRYSAFLRELAVPTNFNIVAIRPLRGSGLVVCEPSLVFGVIDTLFGGVGKFQTRIQQITIVSVWSSQSRGHIAGSTHERRQLRQHQQIFRLLAVPVGRDVELVEKREIHADVEHRGGFPFNVGVGQRVEGDERVDIVVHRDLSHREVLRGGIVGG